MNSYTQEDTDHIKHLNLERTITHNGKKAISVTFTFYEPMDLDEIHTVIPMRKPKIKQDLPGVKTVKGSSGKTFKV